MKKMLMFLLSVFLIIVLVIGCRMQDNDVSDTGGQTTEPLFDNGDGTITENDHGGGQELMWLQAADTTGMTYAEAETWAADLVFAGYDDWRLPSAMDFNTGTPDLVRHSMSNEFGHLYGVELSNPGNAAETMPFVMPPQYYWTGDANAGVAGEAYGFFWSWDGLWLIESYPTSRVMNVTAVRCTGGPPEIPPATEGIVPDSGTVGTKITITGTGFGSESHYVIINKLKCEIVTWTDTQIEAICCPLRAGTYDIKVLPKEGDPTWFIQSFTYITPALSIDAPIEAKVGAKVTIEGTNFGDDTSNFYVYICSKEDEWKKWMAELVERDFDRVTGDSSCTFIVPDMPSGDYNIKVKNYVGWSEPCAGIKVNACGLTTIDFNEHSPGTQLTGNEYADTGVTLSGHWMSDWAVEPVVMRVGVYGPAGTVTVESYCTTGMYIQTDFSVPVNYVSIDLTTFENGDYDLGLILYDSEDNILAETITTGVNGVTYTLEAQSYCKYAAYARFYGYYGETEWGINATYFDNLVFGKVCKQKPCGLTTIDFDDRPADSILTGTEYAGLGAIFSAHWIPELPDFPVVMVVPGYRPGTLSIESYCTTGMYIQVDFSVPVDFVSVEITTFENGDYDLGLTLYDNADNIVAQTVTTGVDDVTYTLEAQSANKNVAYARFYGYYGPANGGVNAVYFDNFIFGITCTSNP